MNRVVRGIALSSRLTIRNMKGQLTQTDLRLRTGLDAIAVRIFDRTLGFLGHIARRSPDRLEKKVLFGWLEPESAHPSGTRRLTWTRQ
eukprot:5798455-Heterocapsa_arctica.AAC.1